MEKKRQEKHDLWEDEEFLNEMDRRIQELESGEVQGIPLEEVKRKVNLSTEERRNIQL